MSPTIELRDVLAALNEIVELLPVVGENKEGLINPFVDGFVAVNEYIQPLVAGEDAANLQYMENALIAIINCYNANEVAQGNAILENELLPLFAGWEKTARKLLKVKFVLCGIDRNASEFHSLLDEAEYEVVGYLNVPAVPMEKDSLHGVPVILIDQLDRVQFDYLVIASAQNEEIEKLLASVAGPERIINYSRLALEFAVVYNELYENNSDLSFLRANLDKAKYDPATEVLITGMSYSLYGVDTALLEKRGVKLCWASQDLYYDYSLIQQALANNAGIKYCVMGTSYFSFDMDLSQLKTQTYLIDQVYYPLLGDAHHYSPSESYSSRAGIDQIDRYIKPPSEPLPSASLLASWATAIGLLTRPEVKEQIWNQPCENLPVEWLAPKRARLHSKNDYPATREENIEIFKSILELLEKKGVRPIVIVFPVSDLYASCLEPSLKERYYELIQEVRKRYSFALYDYLKHPAFVPSDFSDSDHLNKKGAAKMTNILNDILASLD